jgi:Lar family restriction alleviation protein
MTTSLDLLACPFCGSEAVLATTRPDGMFSFVYCGPCGAQGPVEEGRQEERTPAERWNQRSPLPSPPEAAQHSGHSQKPSLKDTQQ